MLPDNASRYRPHPWCQYTLNLTVSPETARMKAVHFHQPFMRICGIFFGREQRLTEALGLGREIYNSLRIKFKLAILLCRFIDGSASSSMPVTSV